VRAPKGEHKEMTVWTSEEAHLFLNSLAADRLQGLRTLASHTGMRRGELAGLRWSDVDLDRGTLGCSAAHDGRQGNGHHHAHGAQPAAAVAGGRNGRSVETPESARTAAAPVTTERFQMRASSSTNRLIPRNDPVDPFLIPDRNP
jgi:integrase